LLKKRGIVKTIIISTVLLTIGAFCLADARNSDSVGTGKMITLPQEQVTLKPGIGQDMVLENCAVCHSLDYITMQPRGSKAQWAATVQKMVRFFGAAIPEDTAQTIIEYLAGQYGSEK